MRLKVYAWTRGYETHKTTPPFRIHQKRPLMCGRPTDNENPISKGEVATIKLVKAVEDLKKILRREGYSEKAIQAILKWYMNEGEG